MGTPLRHSTLNIDMKTKLTAGIIEQIRSATGTVKQVAERFAVSVSTVSKYRPVRRSHLTEAEQDQVIQEWLSHVPTRDTCERLNVHRHTLYKIRRAAMNQIGGTHESN